MEQQSKSVKTAQKVVEQLQERLKQAKAKASRIAARERAKNEKTNRAIDTKRKVLIGAFFLDQLAGDDQQLTKLKAHENGPTFATWLVREMDRAMFGLAPNSQLSESSNSRT